MQNLLERFIRSFQKAITVEMNAMRQRLGPFEVPLAQGRRLVGGDDDKAQFYAFKIVTPNDKLVLQAECTLVYETGEMLVTITELTQGEVTIRSERAINLNYSTYTLVIYPWFLYEKLKTSLESLLTSQNAFVENALMVFGKQTPSKQPHPLQTAHHDLNAVQQEAVQLCSDSNLAYVWGPPGTGKTTTLGHIVIELLRQGHRILITSTTNAAVDQALAKLAALEDAQEYFERGQIIRIGQTSDETFGAALFQVMKRLNTTTQARLDSLNRRCRELHQHIEHCDLILKKLQSDPQRLQTDLFRDVTFETIIVRDLRPVFSEKYARNILKLPIAQQQALIHRRQQRLRHILELCHTSITQHTQELRQKETTVVQNARVILATMTNVYMSSLLQEERFDTVIVEEAGMAILPTVFYCAALARTKVIMVGDPQQLPPIVQSREEYVYQAMGRNIFEVATTNLQHSDNTIMMLTTQYRMHPVIADLVSTLFYEGKLRNGENTVERCEIAGKSPYPDAPLIILDTEGQTTCVVQEGGFSRFNEKTAQMCLDLALEAVQAGIVSVAIITPYVAQSKLIRQLLLKFQEGKQHVECQTIHRFQGNERDLVIIDTVDAPPLSPGVLLSDVSARSSSRNLINVSISRARGKLIIISDVSYFNSHSPRSVINAVLQQAMRIGRRVRWQK